MSGAVSSVGSVSLIPPIITAVAAVVIGIIGWFVSARIAKLSRDSTEALSRITSSINQQQLAVAKLQAETARTQLEVNKQKVILDMLPRRIKLRKELIDAIDARDQEITKNNYQAGDIYNDALKRIWIAEQSARVLFGDDVLDLIRKTLAQLDIREKSLLKIRTNIPSSDMTPHNDNTAAALEIVNLKGELGVAIDKYSALGHVRATA